MRHTLIEVLASIHQFPRKLQSDYARTHAYEFARLASLGLITTRLGDGYGYLWRCTSAGVALIEQTQEDI